VETEGGRLAVEVGLGCWRVVERSSAKPQQAHRDVRALVSLGSCRRPQRRRRAVLALSCQADPGAVCGVRALGVDTATASRGGLSSAVERWTGDWRTGGLVRERNGGFRADDLPAVEELGPMTDVRQPSQTGRPEGEAGDRAWRSRWVGGDSAAAQPEGGRRAQAVRVAAAIGGRRKQHCAARRSSVLERGEVWVLGDA
jgi:hypothetical protein